MFFTWRTLICPMFYIESEGAGDVSGPGSAATPPQKHRLRKVPSCLTHARTQLLARGGGGGSMCKMIQDGGI